MDEIKADGGEAVASLESVATMSGGEKIIQTALDNYGQIGYRGYRGWNLTRPHDLQHVRARVG